MRKAQASAISAENVVDWTRELTFVTPPECQGQIVLRSYACDADYIYERAYDQTDRSIVVYVYEYPAGDCEWDPWNSEPAKGDQVARVEL